MTDLFGHNGGPKIVDRLTLAEAQELPDVDRRPSHVQRYSGKGSPLRAIVALGAYGSVGRFVLMECGHWKDSRAYGADGFWAVSVGRKLPTKTRCGCCRLGYLPSPVDVETVRAFQAKDHP
jgi:hypothetical protein